MEFKIPKRYNVGGQLIEVSQLDCIPNSDVLGHVCVASGKMEIAGYASGILQSESSKTNTFFHELVHSILDTMGEFELSQNEKFVCAFSALLTESVKSME